MWDRTLDLESAPFTENSVTDFATFLCHCAHRNSNPVRASIGAKVNAWRFSAKTEAGQAGPVTVGPGSFEPPRGKGKVQLKAEFAADSLQVASMVMFDAIIDCRNPFGPPPRGSVGL
jgi:hypothetical protein